MARHTATNSRANLLCFASGGLSFCEKYKGLPTGYLRHKDGANCHARRIDDERNWCIRNGMNEHSGVCQSLLDRDESRFYSAVSFILAKNSIKGFRDVAHFGRKR